MKNQNFPTPNNQKSFDQTEQEILTFWKDYDIFKKSIEERSVTNKYVFFDGPPFATGLPHYGHILAGAIKDIIPRYQTMLGKRVERKWGWDCHGVPVEFLVEKKHKIGGKPGIEEMGVDKFNELCRDAVMRCADSWRDTVSRMGRFVDFENDYKTMDPEFMESVWWVFGELWKKGLIYEGEKVVPYSPKLGSPLSNFEANQNYQTIDDPAVTIEFKVAGTDNEYFLAWTTTPWTLPSNVALGFGRDTEYSLVAKNDKKYWVATKAVQRNFGEDAEVLQTQIGKDFFETEYESLFPFFEDKNEKRFIALYDDGDYVSTEAGTGIVHFAPSFGEEDAALCQKFKVFGVNPIDENGYFDETISELTGKYFREDAEVDGSKENNANTWVLEQLKESGSLFKREQIRHDYPFCWRTDCALMYRGIKTWFVDVQKIKQTMLEKNQEINWSPDHLKNGRFGKLLESAPDWAISRNRYWGAPIPVWRGTKTGKCVVITSRKELEEKTGKTVTDLHKHYIDDLTWTEDGEEFVRIPEVLDCWFESGSMPYASVHYPFAADMTVDSDFQSANFIAEGIDQTRGWFYTLHVLGCALFGKNIFQNVITNGIILAEDGQKMSKSKKNYPDPNLIFEKYGADAMRFYLLSSPVVRAENLRFAEHGVQEVLKSVILPIRSAYQFFSTYANIDNWSPTKFTFVRHGEGEHNTAGVYSSKIKNTHKLTEKGQKQVAQTAESLDPFDVLISSPFVRTRETAEIIKSITNFQGEILFDERLREVDFGELEGKKYIPGPERIKNTSTESPESVDERMRDFITEVSKKYPGKNICVVSHGGSIRGAESVFLNTDISDKNEYFSIPQLQTGSARAFLASPNPTTEIDQWICAELQTLLQNYRTKMDEYKIDEALREIPPFIEALTNWYIRRSRSRFWAGAPGEVSTEKNEAYQTLFYALTTLSKVLAPVAPFFAEKLYKDLTGNLSVHLDLLPRANKKFINQELSQKVKSIREVVSLAAGIRARKTIRLRQPLAKLSLALTGNTETNLTQADIQIIEQEANVKKIVILSDAEIQKFAQKIVKVDAKKVGRKFGEKTQELIKAGKAGNYEIHSDQTITIYEETLAVDEYEIAYITAEGFEADSTPQTVVILDTEITEELHLEGLSREIIRVVQDLRKSSGFEVSDRITIQFQTDSETLQKSIEQFGEKIATEVLATEIEIKNNNGEKIKIEEMVLQISINKQ